MSYITKNTLSVYIEKFLTSVAGFLTTFILVRALSENDYGTFKLIMSIGAFSTYIVSMGVDRLPFRYISEFLVEKEYKNINKLLMFSSSLRIGGTLLFILLGSKFSGELGIFFNSNIIFENLFYLVSIYVAFVLINPIGFSVVTGYSQRYLLSYLYIFSNFLKFLLMLLSYFVGLPLLYFVLILVIVAFVEFVFCFFYFIKKTRENYIMHIAEEKRPKKFPYSRTMKYGLYNYFYNGGQVFRDYQADNLVIAHFMTAASVGYYSVAFSIPAIIRGFSPGKILFGAVVPSFVGRYTRNQSIVELQRLFSFLQKLTFFTISPLLIIFGCLSSFIVPLIFGESYIPSIPSMVILTLMSFFQIVADPYYAISHVIEKSVIVFYASLWGLMNLFLDILFVRFWGIEGVAFATGLCGLGILIQFNLFYRYIEKKPLEFPWKSFFRNIFNLIPVILAVVAIIVFSLGFLERFLFIGFSLFGYLVLSFYNNIFDQAEWDYINGQLRLSLKYYRLNLKPI